MTTVLVVGSPRFTGKGLISILMDGDCVLVGTGRIAITEVTTSDITLPKIVNHTGFLAPPEPRRRKAQWKSELQGRRV